VSVGSGWLAVTMQCACWWHSLQLNHLLSPHVLTGSNAVVRHCNSPTASLQVLLVEGEDVPLAGSSAHGEGGRKGDRLGRDQMLQCTGWNGECEFGLLNVRMVDCELLSASCMEVCYTCCNNRCSTFSHPHS